MKDLLPYIIETIEKAKRRYEIHSFNSGAIMVDIWIDGKFYVIQIDGNIIGLSLVTEATTPFDLTPDQSFQDTNEFKSKFQSIFS